MDTSKLILNSPPEAWIALVGVIIGAMLTILGSWLTNRSNITQLRIQLEQKERVHNTNIKREKYEELYILLGHWMGGVFSNYMNLILVTQGHIDYNEYLDQVIESGEKNTFDFKRMEMILDIYGHNLQESWQKVLEAREKHNDIISAHKSAYKAGAIEAPQFIDPLSNSQLEINARVKSLRSLIAEEVKHA